MYTNLFYYYFSYFTRYTIIVNEWRRKIPVIKLLLHIFRVLKIERRVRAYKRGHYFPACLVIFVLVRP